MRAVLFVLAVMGMFACGLLQTDYQWDFWDIGFVGLALSLFLIAMSGADEFWQKFG